MTVKTGTVENAERDLGLTNREQKVTTRPVSATADDQLRELRRRIAEALTTMPKDDTPHCGDCYRRGWKAALRAIEE
jgi:hypothetical protein